MRNPLIQPILSILHDFPSGISEFDLLRQLENQHQVFNDMPEDPNLKLFRQHFLIMNALYQLQISLWQEDHVKLDISPLNIGLTPTEQFSETPDSHWVSDSVEAKLADYYLDWQQYEKTGKEEVETLLNGFYHRLFNQEERQEALNKLMLDDEADKAAIKRQYRKLINQAHPDRGGDAKQFIELRHAYELLMAQ